MAIHFEKKLPIPAEVKKLLDENGQLVDFAGNFICRF